MTDRPHPDPGAAPRRATSPLRRAAAVLFGLMLVAGLGYGLLAYLNELFSFAGKWEGKVLSAVPSPDGRYVAEVSEWNGGATTGFETHVALRGRAEPSTVSDPKRSDDTVAVLFSLPEVKLRWDTPQQLTVESPGGQLMEHRGTWRDVRITCKAP